MRSCGLCTACCTVLGVPSIGKAAGEKCKHLTDKGCGIYDARPAECRTYFCLWADEKAAGLTPDWGRPDRTGLILQSAGHDLNAKGASINVFRVPGGSDYWGQKLLKQRVLRQFPKREVKA